MCLALLVCAGEAQGRQLTAYAGGNASNGYDWTLYAKTVSYTHLTLPTNREV